MPYDVVNRDEARELAADDPHSFLHVVRAEIDLDPSVDAYDDRVYDRARTNLRSMIDSGWLVRDERPAYYVYRLRMDDRTQTGLVGAAAVDDYLEGRIKKHEHTRPVKENDRIRLIRALGAHPDPVFLTHPGIDGLNREVAAVTATAHDVFFTAPDGIEHTLWVVDDAAACARIEGHYRELPCSYVADGHHRAAAASKAFAELRSGLASPSGEESCHFFLTVHFPAEEVRVFDYNRVVRDLNGLTSNALVQAIGAAGFEVAPGYSAKSPAQRGSFGMYLAGSWYRLTADGIPREDLLGGLDVSVLSGRVLRPILGIQDPRTDSRIDFVGGIRGMEELERRVDSGENAVAFSLYPTDLEDVMRVADAGEVMPPKSTWFEPKLRSGMVVQLVDDEPL